MPSEIYTEKRPWGSFTRLAHKKKCTVKIIEVKPRQMLSLQYHLHRVELWIALDSGIKVQVGNKQKMLPKGKMITIPKKAKHRLIGGSKTARILEISTGNVRESDIVRLEDNYGRIKKKPWR